MEIIKIIVNAMISWHRAGEIERQTLIAGEDYAVNYYAVRSILKGVNHSKNFRIGYLKFINDNEAKLTDAFVASNYLNSNLNLLKFKGTPVIIKIKNYNDKLVAERIYEFDAESCKRLMHEHFEKFCMIAEQNYNSSKEEFKTRFKNLEEIKNKFGVVRVDNKRLSDNDGKCYFASFIFEQKLSEENFKEFLRLYGLKNEITDQEETLDYYSQDGRTWHYSWIGGQFEG